MGASLVATVPGRRLAGHGTGRGRSRRAPTGGKRHASGRETGRETALHRLSIDPSGRFFTALAEPVANARVRIDGITVLASRPSGSLQERRPSP